MSEAKQLSAGPELDAAVAVAMGCRLLSYEEMLTEARSVWEQQPRCVFFLDGFRHVGEVDGKPMFQQNVAHYSTEPGACSLAKKWLREQNWDVTVTLFVDGSAFCHGSRENPNGTLYTPDASGSTEEEAICRLVLAVAGAK